MEEIIVQSESPVRLDRYLRRIYLNAKQGVIEKSLRTGKIKLNGKKAKTSDRVAQDDKITLVENLFTNKSSERKRFSKDTVLLAKELFKEYLIFSDTEFVAIDKPCGLAVQGGSKIDVSIVDALEYINYKEDTTHKLVHRLDKDTSGVLLIANGYDAANKISEAFKDNLIEKEYLAVLEGCPAKTEDLLINKIGKDRSDVFEIVKDLGEEGKLAKTQYKVLKSNGGKSLVEFKPKTGRMHQLRFHSQLLGCPIVGDIKYGARKHKRMLLHAKQITIPKSVFGRKIIVKSELPEEFNVVDISTKLR